MEALGSYFSQFDFRPLLVSAKTSVTATAFVFVFGILAAWWMLHVGEGTKGWLDSLFTLPLVLPPTVVGFFLLVLFGKSTPLGAFLTEHGFRLIFSWPATVMAAAVVAFPLMYRTVRAAFEQVDPNMLDAARTLGFSEWKILRRVLLPLSWSGVAAGTLLAFARAMGEFGATLFVAGNLPGITQTMPIAVYFSWAAGDMVTAGVWVLFISVFSFAAVFAVNASITRANRYREADTTA